jgi:predicted phosphodiesterase
MTLSLSTGQFRRTRGEPARPEGGVASDAAVRVGVFSDVHGSGVGLDAVLAELKHARVDRLVCLGDLVEGGPHPVYCLHRVHELGCAVVLGNTDHWLVHHRFGAEDDLRSRLGAWTLAQLDEDDRELVRGFAPTHELDLGGQWLLCVHGTPSSFLEKIDPDASETELRELLGSAAALAAGHSHVQWQRRIGDRVVFNPGRVGGPLGGRELRSERSDFDGIADYAVLTVDGDELTVELHRVEYALEELRSAIEELTRRLDVS